MRTPANFGDRQWLQALAAVLAGLLIAGGEAASLGPVTVESPLAAAVEPVSRAGCALVSGAAAIMSTRRRTG